MKLSSAANYRWCFKGLEPVRILRLFGAKENLTVLMIENYVVRKKLVRKCMKMKKTKLQSLNCKLTCAFDKDGKVHFGIKG